MRASVLCFFLSIALHVLLVFSSIDCI